MKSDTMRAVDDAALPRPWKWTDDTLLWNEKVDHCVLEHGGTNWPMSPENRAAIVSAMNHMPTLITLVAACERRRLVLDARREFGSRAYQENPFSILIYVIGRYLGGCVAGTVVVAGLCDTAWRALQL